MTIPRGLRVANAMRETRATYPALERSKGGRTILTAFPCLSNGQPLHYTHAVSQHAVIVQPGKQCYSGQCVVHTKFHSSWRAPELPCPRGDTAQSETYCLFQLARTAGEQPECASVSLPEAMDLPEVHGWVLLQLAVGVLGYLAWTALKRRSPTKTGAALRGPSWSHYTRPEACWPDTRCAPRRTETI